MQALLRASRQLPRRLRLAPHLHPHRGTLTTTTRPPECEAPPNTSAHIITRPHGFQLRDLTPQDFRSYQHSQHLGADAVGKVHSTESFTTVDGPGIRFLVFMQGCGMRCLMCCNPDTFSFAGGQLMRVDELVEAIKKVAPYLKPNGGGVTASGGEPMLQPTFVASLFDEVHKLGLTTCLDTNGQGTKRHHWDIVLPRTDHVLFCIKHLDPRKYERLTHLRQAPALGFAKELAERGVPYYLRYVYIPGYTDAHDDITALIDFAAEQPTLRAVELLPYHVLGRNKWEQLGLKYPLEGVPLPTSDAIRSTITRIEAAGLRVICNYSEPHHERWKGSRS